MAQERENTTLEKFDAAEAYQAFARYEANAAASEEETKAAEYASAAASAAASAGAGEAKASQNLPETLNLYEQLKHLPYYMPIQGRGKKVGFAITLVVVGLLGAALLTGVINAAEAFPSWHDAIQAPDFLIWALMGTLILAMMASYGPDSIEKIRAVFSNKQQYQALNALQNDVRSLKRALRNLKYTDKDLLRNPQLTGIMKEDLLFKQMLRAEQAQRSALRTWDGQEVMQITPTYDLDFLDQVASLDEQGDLKTMLGIMKHYAGKISPRVQMEQALMSKICDKLNGKNFRALVFKDMLEIMHYARKGLLDANTTESGNKRIQHLIEGYKKSGLLEIYTWAIESAQAGQKERNDFIDSIYALEIDESDHSFVLKSMQERLQQSAKESSRANDVAVTFSSKTAAKTGYIMGWLNALANGAGTFYGGFAILTLSYALAGSSFSFEDFPVWLGVLAGAVFLGSGIASSAGLTANSVQGGFVQMAQARNRYKGESNWPLLYAMKKQSTGFYLLMFFNALMGVAFLGFGWMAGSSLLSNFGAVLHQPTVDFSYVLLTFGVMLVVGLVGYSLLAKSRSGFVKSLFKGLIGIGILGVGLMLSSLLVSNLSGVLGGPAVDASSFVPMLLAVGIALLTGIAGYLLFAKFSLGFVNSLEPQIGDLERVNDLQSQSVPVMDISDKGYIEGRAIIAQAYIVTAAVNVGRYFKRQGIIAKAYSKAIAVKVGRYFKKHPFAASFRLLIVLGSSAAFTGLMVVSTSDMMEQFFGSHEAALAMSIAVGIASVFLFGLLYSPASKVLVKLHKQNIRQMVGISRLNRVRVQPEVADDLGHQEYFKLEAPNGDNSKGNQFLGVTMPNQGPSVGSKK